MLKVAEQKVYNDTFIELVKSGNTKEAAVSAQQFTRNKLREESFAEKILTPIDISNDELDKAEDTELLVKWNDREPDTAPAVNVPLGVVPDGIQFKGSRYPSYFSRLVSPLYSKDIDKLRSYDYDIRSILLELSTKEMAVALDSKFIGKVNSVVGATPGSLLNTATGANAYTGMAQYWEYSGGLNRNNLVLAVQQMLRQKTPFGPLQPDSGQSKGVMLMNNVTGAEFLKWERSEVGGDLAQRQYEEGVPSQKILGLNTIFTIKYDLVPDGVVYFFSSEEFLGKYYRLQPLTVYMENKAYFLQFFQYMNVSMAFGNCRGFMKAKFTA